MGLTAPVRLQQRNVFSGKAIPRFYPRPQDGEVEHAAAAFMSSISGMAEAKLGFVFSFVMSTRVSDPFALLPMTCQR